MNAASASASTDDDDDADDLPPRAFTAAA